MRVAKRKSPRRRSWPAADRVADWPVYSGSRESSAAHERATGRGLFAAHFSHRRLVPGESIFGGSRSGTRRTLPMGRRHACYGKRYAARYGEFVIQNTLASAGNAALGYEPRYDFCRCSGFWPRTRHAISRNFVAYNRTERELRPQVPLYAGAFVAGTLYGSWLPGKHNMWKSGALSTVSQAAIGSGYNFVSEFALDILHKFGMKK